VVHIPLRRPSSEVDVYARLFGRGDAGSGFCTQQVGQGPAARDDGTGREKLPAVRTFAWTRYVAENGEHGKPPGPPQHGSDRPGISLSIQPFFDSESKRNRALFTGRARRRSRVENHGTRAGYYHRHHETGK